MSATLNDPVREVILVGLPGPTHNYGGLSRDNVASSLNRGSISNPRQAALQALDLVRLLKRLGIEAGILPPQLRPHVRTLREHFQGTAEELIRQAAKDAPDMLEKVSSSSAMWAANAATVTAAADASDGKLHLTVANLYTNLHRRIEAEDTYRTLKGIFASVPDAVIHPPLDPEKGFRDEGAANHMRLAPRHNARGLNIYAYGADGSPDDPPTARQNRAAFEAIVRQHSVTSALFVKQNHGVIRHGVFHNDVIAVSNESVLLAHEKAYAGDGLARVEKAYAALAGKSPIVLVIKEEMLAVDEAVHTYLFNSQIVTKPDGTMAIIAPTDTQLLYGGKAARLIREICEDKDNPIAEAHYIDLRQSMSNGGGPACLRLRVPVTARQLAAMKESVNIIATDTLLSELERLINVHYPSALAGEDLANPGLYRQCRELLAELSGIMKLPLLT